MGLSRAVASAEGSDGLLDAVLDGVAPARGRHRAVYALAEAYLLDPAGLTSDGWRAIRAELTVEQVGELVLNLTRFTQNKVRVALGLDLDEVVRQRL
jgi:hypothetical protein